MLNTRKLLYILPDVAYVAELLAGKKEHTFVIQSFRQINGEFIDDEAFVAEHIEKLFSKIDPDEYHLVIPDFLCTNTIVEVADTVESKVKAHLKENLLPDLGLDKDSHELDTFVLTQHQGKTKVQLAAVEKSIFQVIADQAAARKIIISGISSLSWTIKSVISLEPSISIVQAGGFLYLAEHYIGVEQTSSVPVDDVEQLADAIRTLKGAEPSIQTVYLLTNELVAESLKEHVSQTLPLQQLATFKEEENQMPSYSKLLVESGLKSLDIAEYNVPIFHLPKSEQQTSNSVSSEKTAKEIELSDAEDTKPERNQAAEAADTVETDLPAPKALPLPAAVLPASSSLSTKVAVETTDLLEPDFDLENHSDSDLDDSPAEKTTSLPATEKPPEENHSAMPETPAEKSATPTTKIDLLADEPTPPAKPAPTPSHVAKDDDGEVAASATDTAVAPTPVAEDKPPVITPPPAMVIKNKSGVGNVVKMVFVTLTVFFLTVAIGVGIGFGVLSLANKGTGTASPQPTASPTAAPTVIPSPSPTASASATINRADLSILVVNATTIAGHAGTTKKQLETAGFKSVVASNAKGDYEPGTYVLMKTENAGLISTLESDTKLKLTFQPDIATEDAAGKYDAVIVLAK